MDSGIFGGCQEQARTNAANIDSLNKYASSIADYVLEIEAQSTEKFFLVSNEIAEIVKIQQEMQNTQNKNWQIIEDQFEIFEQNIHVLRDCTQLLFTHQQINFNFDTIAALLLVLYSDIKSYRIALYTYRINILNSIPVLLDQRLPMSLVPRESLIKILDSVYDSQKVASNRLSLAIPIQNLLSYYDAKLIREVSSVHQGLLLTLAVPLSSSQTAFNVYRAHLVPMPQEDPKEALQWVVEGEYLAISEDSMETTTLTEAEYQNCLGSSRYRIRHTTMETHLSQSSCLATLYFHSVLTALSVCDTKKIMLPTPEKATNLGYGIWLITSASTSFTLQNYNRLPHLYLYPGLWNTTDLEIYQNTIRFTKLRKNPNPTHWSQTL